MGSFLSSQNTRMTKEEMETALNKAKEIASSSPVVVFRLLVYFTGHGNRAKAEANTNNTNFVEFMVTADNTTISDATMRMFVECIPKKTCFALRVDACHSAGMIEGAKEKVGRSEVKIKSKTYCGYCNRVKVLLKQLGATYKVLELDTESDGGDIQAALAEWTGQRTVPNVFIGGKHIGGCDSVLEKHHAGQLIPLLNDAGAIANNSAQL